MGADEQQALNDYIVFAEEGVDFDQKVDLFQRLIDLGLVSQIDSRFQNQANNLIASGECTPRQDVDVDVEERVNA